VSGEPSSECMEFYYNQTRSASASIHGLVKWSRPSTTKENLDLADLVNLSRFDKPGRKQELTKQLYYTVTKVGFRAVVESGIDELRQAYEVVANEFFSRSTLHAAAHLGLQNLEE
jgi:hypothetical protein